jgi:hypothetical protein
MWPLVTHGLTVNKPADRIPNEASPAQHRSEGEGDFG